MRILLAGCAAIVFVGCSDAPVPEELLGQRSEAASAEDGVLVCHQPNESARKTLSLPAAAVPGHLRHGDVLGECPLRCADATTCDDHDACTIDTCGSDLTCAHSALDCDDGNSCTDDRCAVESGCQNIPNAATCDDGNVCTSDDRCSAGACAATHITGCCRSAADCDDGNLCSSDECFEGSCVNTAVQCSATDACTVGFCDQLTGSCASSAVTCDDANPCTIDTCDPELGCAHTPSPARECAVCGDGFRTLGVESCDDGDNDSGDGCSGACTIESGFTCTGQPSVCGGTFFGPGGPVPDNGVFVTTITVPLPCTVRDITLGISWAVPHTWASDLRIDVLHGGESVTVSNRQGQSSNMVGPYTFSDDAPNAWPPAPVVSLLPAGTYRPYEALSAFAGTNANGTWQLSIQDSAGGDIGTLHYWSLSLTCH